MIDHYRFIYNHIYLRNHYCGRCFNFFENEESRLLSSFTNVKLPRPRGGAVAEKSPELKKGEDADPPHSVEKGEDADPPRLMKKGEDVDPVVTRPPLAAENKGNEEEVLPKADILSKEYKEAMKKRGSGGVGGQTMRMTWKEVGRRG